MAKVTGWTAEQLPGEVPDDQDAPRRDTRGLVKTRKEPERAILAARLPRSDPRFELAAPMSELSLLAKTAGAQVFGEPIVQKRDRVDPATCLGKGAVTELSQRMEEHDAELAIFDNELSPRQRRNLEKILGRKVIDRTELILDIFASHARTPQARLQVEVAQLEYALPRLRKLWTHLDPGMGLRGPGEKQLEVDKRLVNKRIQELKDELAVVRARKEREVKTRAEAFTIALVGYTNAGKSTLMNALTSAEVYVADQLFATLDTRTRTWGVGHNRNALLSDTVGFIRHLPHRLVESFHATLEEVTNADLLLHVVDASDPQPLEQVRAVRHVLEQIGAHERPEIMVLNKIDAAEPDMLTWLEARLVNTARVSAHTGEGLAELRERVNEIAAVDEKEHVFLLDVREGRAIAFLEGRAEIRTKQLEGETLRYEVRCRPRLVGELRSRLLTPKGLVVVGEEVVKEVWEDDGA